MPDIVLMAPAGVEKSLILAGTETPTGPNGETERDAVLLECGDLPDKNLTPSENDLDGIVSRFNQSLADGTAPVPVKLEHISTPLDPLGTVRTIWRDGARLLGKITFPPAVAALVRERGCKGLSCGLDRSPLALTELSLVLRPRIAAAVLLSDDDRAELSRLRAENLTQKVEAQIVQLKLSGMVVPATEGAARVLLNAGDAEKILLSDGQAVGVAEAFTAYLAAQPPLITLGELAQLAAPAGAAATGDGATGDQNSSAATLTDDQRRWLAKSLGVDPTKVEETMKRDTEKARSRAQTPARNGGRE